MCCSMRATIYFLASNHIYFSVSQMIRDIHAAVGVFSESYLVCFLTFIFGLLFTVTGVITFRAADGESSRLIRLSALCLAAVLLLRFILLGFSLMITETLPEASFLYVYRTASIPILFTLLIYVFYAAMLFCYYNELTEEAVPRAAAIRSRQSHWRRQASEIEDPFAVSSFGAGATSPLQLHPGRGGRRLQNLELVMSRNVK